MTIGALVLAAGEGRRMGAIKPLVRVGGRPMLCLVLDALREAGLPALLVTGAHADAVRAMAGDVPVVHAPDHRLGMAHSLRAGLAAMPADWAGALVVLADMPLVRADTLAALARALADGAGAVVPVHRGRRGNPAGFARAAVPALMGLEGDAGARRLLDRLNVLEVAVDDPGVLMDVDRPEDIPAGA